MINTFTIFSTAFAEGHGVVGEKRFSFFHNSILTDKKQISKEEITAHVKLRFASLNPNNDATLSTEEMIANHSEASER